MMARLGTVLFVAGCIVGLPLIGLFGASLFKAQTFDQVAVSAMIFGFPGAAALLLGWAARYVLRG